MKVLFIMGALVGATALQLPAELAAEAPKLAAFYQKMETDPAGAAADLRNSPLAQIVKEVRIPETKGDGAGAPIVVAHGMGDSCFNAGMDSITKAAGTHAGVYSVCVPTGDDDISDTLNGFFMNMNANVDVFAKKVKADAKLANGFNAFGFSQGNSVIRGYIERYNQPPVLNYISVHGTVNGVAGFPQCDPSGLLGPVCDILDEVLGDLCYSEGMQNFLFQADYYRDPTRVGTAEYKEFSQIADWNNENNATAAYTQNFASLSSLYMIKANGDTMVFPNDGEWWGEYAPGGFTKKLQMNETQNYLKDTYGLQTLDKADKIFFNTTDGNHLDFTDEQLFYWIDQRFK